MIPPSPMQVSAAARELGGRVAVAGALCVALLSLWRDNPVWLACLQGGVTLAVGVLIVRLGAAALTRVLDFAREPILPKE